MSEPITLADVASLPAVLNAEQVLALVPISRNSLYSAISTGEIPSVRLGRRILIPTKPLLEMLGVAQ